MSDTTDPTPLTPGQMSEALVQQAHDYSTLSDQLAEILKVKPFKWLELRATVESDTRAERLWSATEDGVAEMVLKLRLKAIEKVMSSLRTRLRVLELEVRNLI